MVFERLTLFELNFEDAQFGPKVLGAGGDVAEAVEGTQEPEPTGGSGRVFPFVALSLVLAVAATVAARRYFGSDEADGLEVGEDVEVERTIEG